MAFKNIKRDSLLILFVQLATWSFACGLPVKEEAHLITFDWDQLRRSTTPKPFDWDQFTWLRRSTTSKPFNWDPFTWLRRSTTPKPFIWNRITFTPDVYKSSISSTPPFVWIIVAAVVLVGLLAALIKCACSMYDGYVSITYDSSPNLHPPPATTIRPVEQLYDFPPSTTLGGIMPNYLATGNASNMYSTSDKPPDYSEVVLSDFVDENKKFKEVSPKPVDTPPPTYGDQNLQRY